MRQEEVRNLRILYNEHCLGSYRFSARPAKISLSNMRGLCRNISPQDVSSSVMHSVGKNVRLGFSVKCYGKTWTNVLANPILLSIKPSQTRWHKATSPPFDCAQRVCGSWVWTGKKGVIYLCSMYLGASAREKIEWPGVMLTAEGWTGVIWRCFLWISGTQVRRSAG